MFPCEFFEIFLRTRFLQNTCRWLLLGCLALCKTCIRDINEEIKIRQARLHIFFLLTLKKAPRFCVFIQKHLFISVDYRIVVQNNFADFAGKHLWWSLFLLLWQSEDLRRLHFRPPVASLCCWFIEGWWFIIQNCRWPSFWGWHKKVSVSWRDRLILQYFQGNPRKII